MGFTLERELPSGQWVTVAAAPVPISPFSLDAPQEDFPVQERPAFRGFPGLQCRVCFNEKEIERYAWERILENPFNPNSDLIWSWKLLSRQDYPPESAMGLLAL